MELQLILSFLLASMALTFMPGPDNIYVLTESLARGAKTGILISIGLISGIMVHTAAAATGISLIIQQSAGLFNVIKYLGAAYLFYLAYQAYKERPIKVDSDFSSGVVETRSHWQLIRTGFFMNVLNPKVSLFFLALLPQFITSDGIWIPTQMIILGGIFMIQGIIIFCMIAWLAGKLNTYLSKPSFWTTTKWIKIGVLSILGITLLLAKK
ncbi:MAG: LysE family translocator [Bacteroidia bacterium]|nr:LysE family translocator [Bacteroidia bacterium]